MTNTRERSFPGVSYHARAVRVWLGVGCGKTPTNGQSAAIAGPMSKGRATRRSAEEALEVGRRQSGPRCAIRNSPQPGGTSK